MYFLIQYTGINDEEPVFFIESDLRTEVTIRLLVHASPGMIELLGYCPQIQWTVPRTHKTIKTIGSWIDPAQFSLNNGLPNMAKWSLLEYEDLQQLIANWKSTPQYTDKTDKNSEFYRNRVFAVEQYAEAQWRLKQTSAGESTETSKAPSTEVKSGSRSRRTRPRKTGS